MNRHNSHTRVSIFLAMLLLFSACEESSTHDLPREKDHPKLIKTIGDPRYGNVYCSLQDGAGNLWFGTTENGLYQYDGKTFRRYLVADGLNSNNILSILEDNAGKLWIGTDAGLCIYAPPAKPGSGAKAFTKIDIPLPGDLPTGEHPNRFNPQQVHSMLQARNGTLWFVTLSGVFRYDGKTFTPFIVDGAANGFLSDNDKVERMLEDRSGNIWFGGRTNEGVFRYDGKSVNPFYTGCLNSERSETQAAQLGLASGAGQARLYLVQ